jgi:hypothetical protein
MIVENPFPQMTFLWDTLERDQKLTLALLADVLDDAEAYATTTQLVGAVKKGNYPLRMSRPAISTALETLFKHELLGKKDARTPGYAFRMDLWRRWIRRMHAVWQVMREERLEFRVPPVHTVRVVAAVAVVLVALGAAVWQWQRSRAPAGAAGPTGSDPRAADHLCLVSIVPQPVEASIQLNDQTPRVGPFAGLVAAGREHRFVVKADGYVDSTLVVTVAAGDTSRYRVALRPRRGGLRVEAHPPAAQVWLDGERIGTGTVERAGLAVPDEHTVEVSLDNYHLQERSVLVLPESTLVVRIQLTPLTMDLHVDTDPDGARILMDGEGRGDAPLVLSGLAFGRHDFRADKAGYLPKDTTLVVDHSTKQQLLLRLTPEPPGILLVRSGDDRPARIYINQQQVGSGELRDTGRQRVVPGLHTIEVVFRDGSVVRDTVEVQSGHIVELLWEAQRLRVLPGGR